MINEYTFKLPPQMVSIIIAALAEQQYKQVAPTLDAIMKQTDEQEKADQAEQARLAAIAAAPPDIPAQQ